MIQALAERAIEMAIDASPHQPRPGEYCFSMMHGLRCAERLLGRSVPLDETINQLRLAAQVIEPLIEAEKDTSAAVRFVDGRGHARRAYRRLMLDLFEQTVDLSESSEEDSLGHELLILGISDEPRISKQRDEPDPSLVLWSMLPLARQEAIDLTSITEIIDRLIGHPGEGRPLHEQKLEDSPDEWTYRDLVGLHALHHLAQLTGHTPWQQRVLEITAYHQNHTQPDYTTYQPWGLAAFLSNPDTVLFAEQQLHDTETHLNIEAGPGALLPALLLADAYASVSAE